MLSRTLEQTLHRALSYAKERRHEYATLEHLLLALTEDRDCIAVLRACLLGPCPTISGPPVSGYLDEELDNLVVEREERPEADRRLPARPAARRDPRAVVRARGGDGGQCARGDLLGAGEPRRVLPPGPGR